MSVLKQVITLGDEDQIRERVEDIVGQGIHLFVADYPDPAKLTLLKVLFERAPGAFLDAAPLVMLFAAHANKPDLAAWTLAHLQVAGRRVGVPEKAVGAFIISECERCTIVAAEAGNADVCAVYCRYVSPAAHDMATYRAIQSGSIPTAQLFLARGFTFAAALDACNRITVLSSREDMRRYLYGMRVASAD